MKKRLFFLVLSVIPLFAALDGFGQETQPQEKSVPLAIVLGLSPVPGDGLLYAGGTGATIAGVADLVAGSAGWALIAVAHSKCRDLDDCNFPGLQMAIGGGIVVGLTYLIDAIGGPLLAINRNEKIKMRPKPFVGVNDDRKVLGVAFRF